MRLGTRYRVVGLLGRGGMGEVYRADDMELNQSVALKFLPEKVARNAADLARLRQEVRVARQIAHPNVCRTYDISEADGQVFVVMEYVDGEDLASVLRRLGRPTPDKALEIARQLCLGIGAAHESGVLHRDLKPANIMIDGRGRVRITDFGLAGTVEEIAAEGGASGTPAYMAPEQLRSGTASIQSDIFSLGLVLFEIFTGKRAADATPHPDPSRPDSDSSVRTPSSLVGGVDPIVERVILRCLERDPSRRPQSAYAVYGALPGGDPLAAAVAAGETPSPELVANAGEEGTVPHLHAWLAVAAVLLGLVWISAMQRPLYKGLGRSPQVLSVLAEQILTQATGTAPPKYSSLGLRYAPADTAKGRGSTDSTAMRRSPRLKPPRSVQFWRRWAPVPLETSDMHDPGSTLDAPPQSYAGSASVVLDAGGRLLALSIVRDRSLDSTTAPRVDWAAILQAAGRNPSTAIPAPPPPRLFAGADTVAAWAVSGPGMPDTTIVAAAVHGKIVDMDTIARGNRLGDLGLPKIPENPFANQGWVLILCLNVIPLIGSIILAIRNLRSGRVDMRGAVVIGLGTSILYALFYLFSVDQHELGIPRVLVYLLAAMPLGHALVHGVALFLGYLAIEPYIRRLWPRVLVSWARLVNGRVRDPIVGRDILVGLLCGLFMFLFSGPLYEHVARSLGLTDEPAALPVRTLITMIGSQSMLAALSVDVALGILRATTGFTLLVILRFLLRNNRAAVIALTILFSLIFVDFSARARWLSLAVSVVVNVVGIYAVFMRFGFLAAIVTLATGLILTDFPWTTELNAWYAQQTILGWVIACVVLGYAFLIAVGGKSIFRDPLSDPVGVAAHPKK